MFDADRGPDRDADLEDGDGSRESLDAGRDSSADAAKQKSLATELVRLAEKRGLTLFHDDAGDAYASIANGETWPVLSRHFARWLRGVLFLDGKGAVARSAVLSDVVLQCEARALYGGDERPVFLRVAKEGDAIYVDLGDDAWRVIEVTARGWRIVEGGDAKVRFRRSGAMLPLPTPRRGGRLDALRPFVNLAEDDAQWSLVAAVLVGAFALAPRGPFPILVLHGEQGTLKTSCTQSCLALIDPRRAGLRALSHDLENLSIAADNGFLLAFDNVSSIDPSLSDGLCRLATDSGYATRTKYENRDESIFSAARPIILNGIGNVVVKADLLDRAVSVELPFVPESRRRRKREVDKLFAAALPGIFGGLLDAVSLALRHSEGVAAGLTTLPRMADFYVAAVAAEPAFGVAPGTFASAYAASRRMGAEVAAEAEPFVLGVRDLVQRLGKWEGSASDLLKAVPRPREVPRTNWPNGPAAAGGILVRAQPSLRSSGVHAYRPTRRASARRWRLWVEKGRPDDAEPSSAAAELETNFPSPDAGNDDRDGGDGPPRSLADRAPGGAPC